MQSNRNNTLEKKIAARIARKKNDVMLRGDFENLGGYDQVGRGLRNLVGEGKLVKIGYGLYARAQPSPLSGQIIPTKNLPALAIEALERLNVELAVSSSARAYNEGFTTQVPTGRVIGVNGRVTRKIGYGGAYITYERISGSTVS